MATSPLWFTTTTAAAETGFHPSTLWRACRRHPGFAVTLGGQYRIPPEHVARLKAGETVEQIAASVRGRSVGVASAA